MENIFFWASATVVASVFLLSARNWTLFLLVLLPGTVCLLGLLVDFWSTLNCAEACPSGHDLGIGPITGIVVLASLFFILVAAIKAALIRRRLLLRRPLV